MDVYKGSDNAYRINNTELFINLDCIEGVE